jgi:hypothetical protein
MITTEVDESLLADTPPSRSSSISSAAGSPACCVSLPRLLPSSPLSGEGGAPASFQRTASDATAQTECGGLHWLYEGMSAATRMGSITSCAPPAAAAAAAAAIAAPLMMPPAAGPAVFTALQRGQGAAAAHSVWQPSCVHTGRLAAPAAAPAVAPPALTPVEAAWVENALQEITRLSSMEVDAGPSQKGGPQAVAPQAATSRCNARLPP